MKQKFGTCLMETTNRKITLPPEDGVEFRLNNPRGETVWKIHVDGCLKFSGNQCDWLLLFPHRCFPDVYIELKKTFRSIAFEQLSNSIAQIERHILNVPGKTRIKECYVVCCHQNHIPKFKTTIANEKSRFRRDYNATLAITKSPFTKQL